MTNEQIVLEFAKKLQAMNVTHSEAHNAIFGPQGIATCFFKNQKAREGFSQTLESKQTRDILMGLESSEESCSGKIAVRVPSSIHAALKREAAQREH